MVSEGEEAVIEKRSTIFKVDLVRIILIAVFLTFAAYFVYYFEENTNFDPNYGVTVYLGIWSINSRLLFFVLYTLLFTSVCLNKFHNYYTSGFYKTIAVRIGYSEFVKKSIVSVIKNTLCFVIITNVLLLIMTHLFWSNISLGPQYAEPIFSDNTILNLGGFLLFSTIGSVVYSVFLLICIPIFKNKYVFQLFTLVYTILSIYLGLIIMTGMFPLALIFRSRTITEVIAYSISPVNLLIPGMMFESYGLHNAVPCIIVYSLVARSIYKYLLQREYENG